MNKPLATVDAVRTERVKRNTRQDEIDFLTFTKTIDTENKYVKSMPCTELSAFLFASIVYLEDDECICNFGN